MEGSSFHNSQTPRIAFTYQGATKAGFQMMEVIDDVDGTVSGVAGGACIVTSNPIL